MTSTLEMTLGELCESIDYGVTTSANFTNVVGPKFLRITDLGVNGVDWQKVPHCIVSSSDERSCLLQDGDIVVARTGGTVGKSFLVQKPPRAVSASYLLRLRPRSERVLPEYLNLFFGSGRYWSQLMEAARGAAQPNVNATTLSAITILVPSLEEQRSTADQLKAQLSAVEEARQAAQAQVNEIRLLKTHALTTVLGRITNALPIGEVAKVQSGFAFKSHEFRKHGVRLLRNTNILPGRVYWNDTVCLPPESVNEYSAYALTKGDVLISLDRPIISSGIKVARVASTDLPALLVQRVGRFLIDPSLINPDYLHAFVQTQTFIDSISGHDQSLGVPHISPRQIESIAIPLPNLTEQERLAKTLNSITTSCHAAQIAAEAQVCDTELLSSRLLAKAFEEN